MLPKRRKPTHVGVILHEEFLKPLGLTSRQFAEKLGGNWTEVKVEAIIQGKENIPDEALPAIAAQLGTTAHFWSHLQSVYNQWKEIQRKNVKGAPKPWKKAQ